MHMKKFVAIILVMVLSCSVLGGCSKKETKDTQAPKTEVTQAVAKDTGNKDTGNKDTGNKDMPVIKLPFTIMSSITDTQEVQDALNAILKEKIGVQVELIPIEVANWQTQLNLLLSGSGDSIDLFSSFYYTSISNLVSNGQIIAIDDLLSQYGSGIMDNIDKSYLDCAKVNGKLYGVPSFNAYCTGNDFFVRADLAKSAGIDTSKVNDWDSLTDMMIKLKKAYPENDIIPGTNQGYYVPKDVDNLGDTNLLGVLMDPTKSTTISNYYESDQFKKMLEYAKVWKKNNLFAADPLNNNETPANFVMNGTAIGQMGYSFNAQIDAQIQGNSYSKEMAGLMLTKPLATTSSVTSSTWHISAFCKNPDAAMKVLNELYSDPKVSDLMINGIEGKHHKINSDGLCELMPGVKDAFSQNGWIIGIGIFWPNMSIATPWATDPKGYYQAMKDANESCDKSLALGFVYDSSKTVNEITACSNIVSQYWNSLMYAEVNIDEVLPVFQKALKDAGIDTIIADKQQQLDAWLKNK